MILYVLFSGVAALAVWYWISGAEQTMTLVVLWAATTAGLSLLQWLLVELLAGHAPRNRAFRAVQPGPSDRHPPDPAASVPLWARWYLETKPREGAVVTSCSFVEFDERGDYLDFAQHRHAYEKVLALARQADPLTFVVYVHGWRHSGQSHDVIAFNEFLAQLSAAEAHGPRPRRVHGLYLAWRGAALKHVVPEDDAWAAVNERYGEEIIDRRQRGRIEALTFLLETLSYFDRKSVPEHKVSGTQLSRTVFSCAFAAKRNAPECQVLLMGHSLGGLMLERTIQNAAIGELTEAWPWGAEHPAMRVNPLPFDTILILNSAAPSIYAKQFQSYLAAHRQAMVSARVPHANLPFVFSVTSEADVATKIAHPIANSLCFLVPSLRREYPGSDFILEERGDFASVRIPQYYYYQRTPGHNPLLVNRFIERLATATDGPEQKAGKEARWTRVRSNLAAKRPNPTAFDTTLPDGTVAGWQIAFPPHAGSKDDRFSWYERRRPVVWTRTPPESGRYRYKDTAYWVVRCPKEISSGHNDIWSQAAMDMYAALHRISLGASPGASQC